MNRHKITKRFLIIVFFIYLVKNIALLPSISPTIQEIAVKITNHPFMLSLHDELTNVPIESKLNIMYITYNIRRMYYNLALSQDTILKISEKIGLNNWDSIDYFNTFVFITALYILYKDVNKNNKIIQKMKNNGIVTNKMNIIQITLLIIYTTLYRDVEPVF